jgi:hypothetical protein
MKATVYYDKLGPAANVAFSMAASDGSSVTIGAVGQRDLRRNRGLAGSSGKIREQQCLLSKKVNERVLRADAHSS